MAHDHPRQPGDETASSDESRSGTAGPITIDTADPAIESAVEHQADWKTHPDTTLRVETTQVGEPSPLYISGVRTVVIDDEPRQDQGRRSEGGGRTRDGGKQGDRREKGGQDQGQDQGGRDRGPEDRGRHRDAGHRQDQGRDDRKDREDREDRDDRDEADREDRPDRARSQPPMSMTKSLMLMAGVALVCGVLGAVGYSYFFGPKGEGSNASQDKNESAKGKQASSSKKSGGGGSSKDSGKESNSQASTSSSIPGFTSAEDSDTLKKQIMDLMQRVDRLGERVDRMARPKDETPPVLRTMQIKMGELAREMDEVAALPARVRHYDNRLETLQEDLKTLRARIETMPGGSTAGRTTPGVTLPPAMGATGKADASSSPTMDLGIGLLERGQYATAREVFLRLQVAQPDDARVWYLSALAEGLTSGRWDGEAKRLAEKGLECERGGHPSAAEIDAALATGTPIKGEDWIASLRRRVLGAGNGRDHPRS